MTPSYHCPLLWWCCRKEKYDNFPSPSLMALVQKMMTIITITFFGGFVTKKVTTTVLSPSFMVVVL
jgi:hypothetical protein